MAVRSAPSGGRPSYMGWGPPFGRLWRPNSAVLALTARTLGCVPAIPNTRPERAPRARSSVPASLASGGGGPGGTPPGGEVAPSGAAGYWGRRWPGYPAADGYRAAAGRGCSREEDPAAFGGW